VSEWAVDDCGEVWLLARPSRPGCRKRPVQTCVQEAGRGGENNLTGKGIESTTVQSEI